MTDLRRDPSLPLAGAPDPWASSSMPSPRGGPPYHMTEMIEAEPALARRILERLARRETTAAQLAERLRVVAASGRPVVVTGCGTSEHAALAAVEILRDGFRIVGLPSSPGAGGAAISVQALEAALDAELGVEAGVMIAISHEGGTWATNEALSAARRLGVETALITVSAASPAAALADVVVTTDELDTSWCHTVGYVSPIVATVAVAAHLRGARPDVDGIVALMAAGLDPERIEATEALASGLAGVERIVVVGTGADRPAARELVLKIEEGTHLPAAMRDLETLLHGHLAAIDDRTGVVLVLSDRRALEARAARAEQALRACAEIGAPGGAIVSGAASRLLAAERTPLGRIVVPDAPSLPPPVAALLGTAVPLQLLTERLARCRGVDPDPIRRDDPAYLRAGEV